MVRATLFLKRHHPTWGAGRIRVELLTHYDVSCVPAERSMQRWFKEKKLTLALSLVFFGTFEGHRVYAKSLRCDAAQVTKEFQD